MTTDLSALNGLSVANDLSTAGTVSAAGGTWVPTGGVTAGAVPGTAAGLSAAGTVFVVTCTGATGLSLAGETTGVELTLAEEDAAEAPSDLPEAADDAAGSRSDVVFVMSRL